MPPLNEEEATTVGGGGRRGRESELGPEAMVRFYSSSHFLRSLRLLHSNPYLLSLYVDASSLSPPLSKL